MAKYSLGWRTVTATAVANTTNMTDSGYPTFLQGGNSTQRLVVSEVYIGGEDTASLPATLVLARDSTVAATGISGNTNALLDGSGTAPATIAIFGNVSTTKPQRSATLALLGLSLNTFGGIVRWVAAPGSEIAVVGNTQPLGELSLSSVTGAAKTSGHILYEVV
jgi:hypothetical protein